MYMVFMAKYSILALYKFAFCKSGCFRDGFIFALFYG